MSENNAATTQTVHTLASPPPHATSLHEPILDESVPDAAALNAISLDPPRHHAPCLDALCFPHIVDAILCYASYESLLSFRATGKAFRDAADKLLLDHVFVEDHRIDPMPPWDSSIRDVILSKEKRRLPALFAGQPDWIEDFRVVDGPGYIPLRQLPNGTRKAPQATWARSKGGEHKHHFAQPTTNLVYFGHDPSTISRAQTVGLLSLGAPSKVVINIAHDCCDLASETNSLRPAATFPELTVSLRYLQAGPTPIIHVVFISRQRPNDSGESGPDGKRCITPYWARDDSLKRPMASPVEIQHRTHISSNPTSTIRVDRLADIVARTTERLWPFNVRITLVGFPLPCLAPALYLPHRQEPSPSAEQVLQSFNEEVFPALDHEDSVALSAGIENIRKGLEQTEIVDHETYRRRVGEEAWKMETVWEHDG